MFDFESCKAFLAHQISLLESAGFGVQFKSVQTPIESVSYRFEKDRLLGEFVVWERGDTSMVLYDSDSILVDRSDIRLDRQKDDGVEQLRKFFEMALEMGKQKGH